MKKRLLYLALALIAAPLLWGQSTVVCTTSSPGTVIGSCASGFSSPVTTDPVSATGVWTFNNAANTPITCSDGLIDSTLTAGRVTVAGASGRLSGDADLTFATDTLTATKVSVKAGSGSGALSVGGVLCKGAPAQATTGTSEEVLATCTIPANTLSANGASLRFIFFAHTSANANGKVLKVRIGGIAGTVICTQSGNLNNQNIATQNPATVTRTGASTAATVCAPWVVSDSASSSSVTGATYQFQRAAASMTWANANDLVITGQTVTASGDLTLDSYVVEVVQ